MPVVACSSSSALSSEISAAISINDGFLPFPDGRCCVVFDCGAGRDGRFIRCSSFAISNSAEAAFGRPIRAFSCVSTPSLLL